MPKSIAELFKRKKIQTYDGRGIISRSEKTIT